MKNFILTFFCLSFALTAMAQTAVTGNVVDNKGETVIGATVLEEGTTNGTVTDIDGNFALTVASPNATLQISNFGYQDQSVALNGRTTINVILSDDAVMLQDVVAIGYGRVKKSDATGAVTAIKPDELNKGLATNPQDMLQGKVAGVNITNDGGRPGTGSAIRIRGNASLTGSNEPLIVIDGLALENSGALTAINPNDIETFTVLKDASATAIYGSRASNGVIIITTKKGKEGQKPQFTYNGNMSVSNLVKRIEVLTGDELRQYAKDLKLSETAQSYLGTENTDWQKEIYRPAIGTEHNFTIAGGAKNMPYRVGLGFTFQDGVLKTSNMHRGTLSVSLNPTFFDKHLTFNINAKATYVGERKADEGAIGAALAMDPTQPVFGIDKNAETLGDDGQNFGGYYQRTNPSNEDDDNYLTKWNDQSVRNPLATLMLKDNRYKTYGFIGNLEIDYKIHGFEDLRLHINMGMDYKKEKETFENSPQSSEDFYHGRYGGTDRTKNNMSFTAYAQYDKDFAKTQHIDVMAGYEYQYYLFERGETNAWGIYRSTHNTMAGEEYERYYNAFGSRRYLTSLFGRLNYAAFDRYLLTVTFRADASSNFRPEKRWGLFPSVALAWKMQEEKFLREVKWLNELKLRLGWGTTGQQDVGRGEAPYLAIFDVSKDYAYYTLGEIDPITGDYIYCESYRPREINRAISWEVTTTYNAGVDFGFLKGRITGAIDYYYRITNALINAAVVVPAGSNFKNKVPANIGSFVNTGFEFTLNTKPIVKKNFVWDLNFNASYNKNKITKLTLGEGEGYYVPEGRISVGTGKNIQAQMVGYPAWSFLVYETKINDAGEYYFVDRNGDGNIDEKDLYCYKNAMPDFMLGFTTTFTIKKFDISIALRANIGNYMYNDNLANSLRAVEKANVYSTKTGGFNNVTQLAYDTYWYGFKSDSENFKGEYALSDFLVENASFLRCDKITVGYNITKPNIRVFATVQNPFTITGYKGLDPERFNGIDNNYYPRPLVGLVGLTYNF